MSTTHDNQRKLQERLAMFIALEDRLANETIEFFLGQGYSLGQIRTAKKHLKVVSQKSSKGLWIWHLPDQKA